VSTMNPANIANALSVVSTKVETKACAVRMISIFHQHATTMALQTNLVSAAGVKDPATTITTTTMARLTISVVVRTTVVVDTTDMVLPVADMAMNPFRLQNFTVAKLEEAAATMMAHNVEAKIAALVVATKVALVVATKVAIVEATIAVCRVATVVVVEICAALVEAANSATLAGNMVVPLLNAISQVVVVEVDLPNSLIITELMVISLAQCEVAMTKTTACKAIVLLEASMAEVSTVDAVGMIAAAMAVRECSVMSAASTTTAMICMRNMSQRSSKASICAGFVAEATCACVVEAVVPVVPMATMTVPP